MINYFKLPIYLLIAILIIIALTIYELINETMNFVKYKISYLTKRTQ